MAGRFPLYTDADVQGQVIRALTSAGWDVLRKKRSREPAVAMEGLAATWRKVHESAGQIERVDSRSEGKDRKEVEHYTLNVYYVTKDDPVVRR